MDEFNHELIELQNNSVNSFERLVKAFEAGDSVAVSEAIKEHRDSLQALSIGICCEENEHMDETHICHVAKDGTLFCNDSKEESDESLTYRYATDEETAKTDDFDAQMAIIEGAMTELDSVGNDIDRRLEVLVDNITTYNKMPKVWQQNELGIRYFETITREKNALIKMMDFYKKNLGCIGDAIDDVKENN